MNVRIIISLWKVIYSHEYTIKYIPFTFDAFIIIPP
jgi:hypothetical protein